MKGRKERGGDDLLFESSSSSPWSVFLLRLWPWPFFYNLLFLFLSRKPPFILLDLLRPASKMMNEPDRAS